MTFSFYVPDDYVEKFYEHLKVFEELTDNNIRWSIINNKVLLEIYDCYLDYLNKFREYLESIGALKLEAIQKNIDFFSEVVKKQSGIIV
jgi:hypothetical protein